MKEGWKYVKLGEVCDVNAGSTPLKSKKEYWDNGTIPWFTIDDIREQGRIIHKTNKHLTKEGASKTRIFPVDTVLLCCTASVGEYALTKIETASNQQFNGLVIKDKEQICPCFLLYYCATLKEHLLQLSGKTTIDFVSGMKVKNLTVPIPPLSEQQQIVSFLDSEFAKIDAMKANAELALQNAKDLFQASLKEMMTPKEGWEEKKLSEIATIINGYAFPSTSFKNHGDCKIIKITNVGVGEFIKDKTFTNVSPKEYNDFFAYSNDIVIALTRTVISDGLKCAIVPEDYNESLINQRVAAIRIKNNTVRKYVYMILCAKSTISYVLNHVNTLMQPNLSINDLRNMPISLPKDELTLNNLVYVQESTRKDIEVLQANYTRIISECDALKQALLRQVFE